MPTAPPSTPATNRQVVYAAAPAAGALPDPKLTFELTESPTEGLLEMLAQDEVLVQNHLLSVDPYHRVSLYDPAKTSSSSPPTPIGTILGTHGTGQIIASNNDRFPVGSHVCGWLRWEQVTQVSAANSSYLEILDPDLDPVLYLGPLGTPGLTGWAGVTQVAQLAPGQLALISGVNGAVGSMAAQTAKHLGLKVIGTAGSDEKAAELKSRLNVDAVINHRHAGSLQGAVGQACPDGIDFYFDVVGGELLDAAIANMNEGGHIAIAGMISQNNLAPEQRYGLKNLPETVGMDITIQTYDNGAYKHLLPEMRATMGPLLRDGTIVFSPHITAGIETMPTALHDIFSGKAQGTRIVDVR